MTAGLGFLDRGSHPSPFQGEDKDEGAHRSHPPSPGLSLGEGEGSTGGAAWPSRCRHARTIPGGSALGIYIHIPFCRAKCPYCDFNSRPIRADRVGARLPSGPSRDDQEIVAYVAALEREMGLRLEPGAPVDTVYFGGGTPTTLAPTLLGRLLAALRGRVSLAPDAEITVEANPESAQREALTDLRAAGFNRLSLGAQSFDDEVLAVLGRRHDAARAVEAIGEARALGWDNIGIDLIFGVPGQSLAQWIGTVQRAVALCPQHVSAYCLTFEPGTPFDRRRAAGELVEVGEEIELEMYAEARLMLRRTGYDHYEISNFALPGRRCGHNDKCWHGADYIGLGAGAHSCVGGVRWANVPDPARYISLLQRGGLPVRYAERLSGRRRMDEQLILELRTAQGACLARLGARCGRDAAGEYRNPIQRLVESGLAVSDGSYLVLTERGMTLASEVAMHIMAS